MTAKDRETVAIAIGVLIICIGAALVSGCNTGLKASYASLAAAESIAGASAEAFVRFNAEQESKVVAEAKTREEGNKAFAEWRSKADHIVQAIEGVHASVKLARDGIKDVAAGIRSPSDLSGWIAAALNAAMNLKRLLTGLGIKMPGGI